MQVFPATKEFYKLYIERMVIAANIAKEKYDKILEAYEYIQGEIKGFKSDLEKYGYDLEFLLSKKGRSTIKSILACNNEDRNRYIQITLQEHHRISHLLFKARNSAVKYKKLSEITKAEYTFIIERINDLVANEIVKGYKHDLGHGLGVYKVIADAKHRTTRKGEPSTMIDWEASNANKKRLIEAGKTPYHSEKAPHGEKWLVRRTVNHRAFLSWARTPTTDKAYMDLYTYKMETHESRNPITKKLYAFVEANPGAYLNYL